MKGIILSGGLGTRLYPATKAISKQLLPLYDKPMVYYPLTTLMLAGIREFALITTSDDIGNYRKLLGSGSQWGVSIQYFVQDKPEGIAQALLIAEDFIAGSPSALVLGDNIFFGHGLQDILLRAATLEDGAISFGYRVSDPQRYGVVELNSAGKAVRIVEKPTTQISNWAVVGLYFFDGTAPGRVRQLRPSARGELEITDLNNLYLADGKLNVELMGRGFAWFDAGTHDSWLEASQFVQTIFRRQGQSIACPEEIAFLRGYINAADLIAMADGLGKTGYADYLRRLAEESR